MYLGAREKKTIVSIPLLPSFIRANFTVKPGLVWAIGNFSGTPPGNPALEIATQTYKVVVLIGTRLVNNVSGNSSLGTA